MWRVAAWLGWIALVGAPIGCASDDTASDEGSDTSTDAGSESGDSGHSDGGPGSDSGTGDGGNDGSGTGDGGDTGDTGGYEGFGAVTKGHEDCPSAWDQITVTSLDDSGPGTLREALSAGCRLITFDVGGTITLASTLNIPHSYITIDGLSAPAPGITIEQPGSVATTIEAGNSTGPISDVIIHHLRMDGLAMGTEQEGADIWGIDGEKNAVSRIIIDHVTARGAKDGAFDLWSDVDDVTLSWNLIHDTVKMLHFSTGDIALDRDRVSIHHNVFARNNERQIRIRHDSDLIDYVNNVVWGWGWFEAGAAGLHVAYDDGEANPSLNVVGNVFHFVTGLHGDEDDAIKWEQGTDVGTLYFDDNALPPGELDATSNGGPLSIPSAAQVTTYPSSDLAQSVVPLVGTHHPTSEETALIDEIAAAI